MMLLMGYVVYSPFIIIAWMVVNLYMMVNNYVRFVYGWKQLLFFGTLLGEIIKP